jgi:hypothetical protein
MTSSIAHRGAAALGAAMMVRTVIYRRIVLALCAAACLAPVGCQRTSELGPVANLAQAAKIRTALSGEGGGEEGPAEPVGIGWATLKGRFTYDGEPPVMPPYSVNKEYDVCAPGGQAPPQEVLLVDESTRGIANIAVYARNASRVHETAAPSDEPLVFDQKTCIFLTHVMGATVGQPIEIKNSDPVGHNTKVEGRNTFNQTIPARGGVAWATQKEEPVPAYVRCSIHPWMVSYILARNNLYFAITTQDGSFEIPNLPAGEEVEIQFWHEHAAGAQGALVVDAPEAKALKWSRNGRIKVHLQEGEPLEINIVVPPTAFKEI